MGARLREERNRLGIIQAALAEQADVSKSAWIKWEKGESPPSAAGLAAVAEAGGDVIYILTGQRTHPGRAGHPVGPSRSDVEAELERLEAEAAKTALSEEYVANLRAALTRIATDPVAAVDASLQARADHILRRQLKDEAAAERWRARLFEQVEAKERYAQDLLRLVASMSLDIDPRVERELTILLYGHGMEAEELIPLLDAMRKAEAVVWQNDTGLLGSGKKP